MTNHRSLLLRIFLSTGLGLLSLACGDDDDGGSHAVGGAGQGGHGGSSSGAGGDPALAGQGGGDAGSGIGGEAAGGEGGQAGACVALDLGRRQFFYNVIGELTGLRYPVQALADSTLPDYVLVEFYDSTTPTDNGTLPPLVNGDFDLTDPPDDRLTTCQHCVSLVIDVSEGYDAYGFPFFEPTRRYYARSGSVRLDEVHDPLNFALENSALLGSVSNIELEEIDLNDPEAPFVDGSDCFTIAEAAFDTRPTPGADCRDLDDCGNEMLEVCDPLSLTCLDDMPCNVDQPCAGDAFCIQQNPLTFFGACYPSCTPFASGSCPEGQACLQYGLSEQFGYCLWTGDGELGATCPTDDAASSCAGDAVCLGTCAAQCAFFSGTPACPAGSACDVLGHCLAPDAADPAALGEPCQDGVELASPCAWNGARFDGICFTYDSAEPAICGQSCFVDANDYDGDADDGVDDPDCAADSFCALRFTSGLGICLPDPVCGDGARGEVIEVCDDGNEISGDGCSADCLAVEYAPLCAAALAVPDGGSVQGDTEGGVDGFQASCQLGLARSVVYTFAAPGPGQLQLLLTSETGQTVSVRSDCANVSSELGCGYAFTDEPLLVQLAETPGAPLTVVVSAYTVLEQGPFTLAAEFTPQVCGDSLIVGGEVCDDGNTQNGDGCSADCLAIEYAYYCNNAEDLPLNVSVSGEISGQRSLYDPSCGYGHGADALYRITAPQAGTLTVSLDQTVVAGVYLDLALFALDGCDAPDKVTELACSSVYDPAEVLTLAVRKNQTVFFVVDGQETESGQYALSAQLQ